MDVHYEQNLKRRALNELASRGLDSSHRLLIEWTGKGKRVLEIGCATGYITRELRSQDCTVVGIELDAEAAESARKFCETLLVGDAQDYVLNYDLQGPFDVVLLGDVLEHLVDPWAVLRGLQKHLKPCGRILVSLPNVAFFKSRWNLLWGRWEYQDLGLMDRTHLRFFTFDSFHRLAWKCGYHVKKYTINEGRCPGGILFQRIPILDYYFGKLSKYLQRTFPNLFGYHFTFELISMSDNCGS